LRGVVKATYLRGEIVYADGRFCGKARGHEYAHS
jgi:dihydroorotase-like cyclic amidohydrolase